MKHCFLSLAVVVTNPMAAPRSFIPAITFLIDFRFVIVHCAKNFALNNVSDYRGCAVTMGRCGGIRRTLNKDADNAKGGVVRKFILKCGSSFDGRATGWVSVFVDELPSKDS